MARISCYFSISHLHVWSDNIKHNHQIGLLKFFEEKLFNPATFTKIYKHEETVIKIRTVRTIFLTHSHLGQTKWLDTDVNSTLTVQHLKNLLMIRCCFY